VDAMDKNDQGQEKIRSHKPVAQESADDKPGTPAA